MRTNVGLALGAMGGVVMLVVAGVMLSNTKAARRRRMIKRTMKTVRNVGTAMQKLGALWIIFEILGVFIPFWMKMLNFTLQMRKKVILWM